MSAKRCDMRKMLLAAWSIALLTGCDSNETSFYIEHMKVQPKAPECEAKAGDAPVAGGMLDLAFRNGYFSYFQLSNKLIAQEDMANLRPETNGIFIEGMEVYLQAPFMKGSEPIGGIEYYEFERYLEPESQDIAPGYAVSPDMARTLADALSCPQFHPANYPAPWINGSYDVELGTVISTVRFLGHTNGGVEVETPEFSVPIDLCCGCSINWITCLGEASAKCDEPDDIEVCTPGVVSGGNWYDCRWLYYSPNDPVCNASGS